MADIIDFRPEPAEEPDIFSMDTRQLRDYLQQLREQIALLPDVVPQNSSGTLTYTREAVERYMTAEEWENLIATKPNWTFVMT